jgi:hypothetical protein
MKVTFECRVGHLLEKQLRPASPAQHRLRQCPHRPANHLAAALKQSRVLGRVHKDESKAGHQVVKSLLQTILRRTIESLAGGRLKCLFFKKN